MVATEDNYWLLRAQALCALGRTAEARTNIQTILDRYPNHSEAQTLLRQIPTAP